MSRVSPLPGDVVIGDYNDPDTGENYLLYGSPNPECSCGYPRSPCTNSQLDCLTEKSDD